MMFYIRSLALFVLIAVPLGVAAAQGEDINAPNGIIMPTIGGNGTVFIDNDDVRVQEPIIPQVTFLNDAPPKSLQERVGRLVQGIETDVPPEYDIYGYELRRYMAQTGNEQIYTSQDFLIEQVKNVRKANIIYKYWDEALAKEVAELEKIVDREDVPPIVRTTLRQNKATIRSFMVDLKKWLDANEQLLMFLIGQKTMYQLEYPKVTFTNTEQNAEFQKLLTARQKEVIEIRQYAPFAIMVY